MGEGQGVDLGVNRSLHPVVGMAKAGHRRAATAIEVSLAVRPDQEAALPAGGEEGRGEGRAMKQMGHGQLD
jgi:hypothetical protein